jgi:enediyne biosynthesis protein E3
MKFLLHKIRNRLMRISPDETKFETRGFTASSDQQREYLESIGDTFVFGYHAALQIPEVNALASYMEEHVPNDMIGFAYEGAAMAIALTDFMKFKRKGNFQAFIAGPGYNHSYMAHVGLGWAIARVPFLYKWALKNADPLLKWLAVEGYGFHQCYFHTHKTLFLKKFPKQLKGYASRAFYQGVGRCLWFVHGSNPTPMKTTIEGFHKDYHSDLWSGLGLACAYAGGIDRVEVEHLIETAGPYNMDFAQGVAFAAKARVRANNLTAHTEMVAQCACHCSAEQAAEYTDLALKNLDESTSTPAYEIWRKRIKTQIFENNAISA